MKHSPPEQRKKLVIVLAFVGLASFGVTSIFLFGDRGEADGKTSIETTTGSAGNYSLRRTGPKVAVFDQDPRDSSLNSVPSRSELNLNPEPKDYEAQALILDYFRRGDLVECSDVLSNMPINAFYSKLLKITAKRYAEERPAKSVSWLDSLDISEANVPAFRECARILGDDPEWLLSLVANVKNDRFREKALQHGLPLLASNGLDSTLKFLNSPELSEISKGFLVESAVLGLDEVAGKAFIEQIAGSGNLSGLANDHLFHDAIKHVARRNFNFTKQVLDGNVLPPEVQLAVSRDLTKNWATHSPRGAASLAQTLEPGPITDEVIAGLVLGLQDTQPSNAIPWAATIGDKEIRVESMKNLIARSGAEIEIVRNELNTLNLDENELNLYRKLIDEISQ